MPRTNPVPDSEKEIGARLRVVRNKLKLEQVAFARQLEIDSRLLGAYEHGRIPLPYYVGSRLWEKFDVNPQWLVENGFPMSLPFKAALMPRDIPPRMLFSEAYEKFIKLRLKAEIDLRDLLMTAALELPDAKLYLRCFEGEPSEGIIALRLASQFIEDRIVFAERTNQASFCHALIEFLSEWKLPLSPKSSTALAKQKRSGTQKKRK